MAVIQLHPTALRVGHPIPVALRDAAGQLLMPRGTLLADETQRQQLIARGIYVDAADSEQFRKALAGKLDSMVRSNALLGQIARAVPDAADCGPAAPRRHADPIAAWNAVLMRASALLHDAPQADFGARVERIDREALSLVEADADASLLTLIHSTTQETHQYSVTHALLVSAVCELAARHLSWPADWRPSLRRAAFTMNLAMTTLQDQLAVQDSPVTPRQREQIDSHASRGSRVMREAGVADELWLQAVEHHHASPPGPLDELPAPLQLARLVQRADIFAARLSPRRMRRAMAATAAAKAAYLDERQQADAAGAAIIKAVGIYPPGSYVRLASTEVAVVLRRGRRANEPLVASVMGRSGTPLGEPAVRDTRQKAHEIAGGVAPHEVKLRLNLQRLLQL
ncbi:phosphohydrolase [Piscinibacter sp. XHJ-5]|uniref:HD-GYP domain-containing protein n=1 Tax=Piscinibacter sp. XHJ-5 TaxID=3037797 RepID=UPI0024535F3E|nr:phosphohydrolase [Piscinibacter sp. XHJ-5]